MFSHLTSTSMYIPVSISKMFSSCFPLRSVNDGCIMPSVLIQAPYTPFLTELMYQNMKMLIDPISVQDKDTLSIHYLMLPHVR